MPNPFETPPMPQGESGEERVYKTNSGEEESRGAEKDEKPEGGKLEEEMNSELIEKLEELNLLEDDKVNILLVKGGLKPACEIDLSIKTQYEEGLREYTREEEIQKILRSIEENSLPHKVGEREVIPEEYEKIDNPGIKKLSKRERINILLARSQEELDLLIDAIEQGSDELQGRAFGFPPTAVEAFIGKRKRLELEKLPPEIQKSDALLFSSPILSADNWEEEVKQGQIYADFIKKVSPKIYQEMKNLTLKSRGLEESEQEVLEKEKAWREKEKEIEEWADSQGEKIDDGIKEAVVACEMMKLHPSASCEGHIDRGFSAPWVEFAVPNKPEERFIGEKEVFQKVAEKYGVSVEDVKRMRNFDAWGEAVTEASKSGETEEYKKWREENEKLLKKVSVLLEEFYQDWKVPPDVRLRIQVFGEGHFRIHNGGEYYKPAEELTQEQKNELPHRLEGHREETREFAEFLKRKYFLDDKTFSEEPKFEKPKGEE